MPPRLGQHILINPAPIRTALDALALEKGDTVIEIGPGNGALTVPLLRALERSHGNLILVERDKRLAAELERQLENASGNPSADGVSSSVSAPASPNRGKPTVRLIEGDIRRELPKLLLEHRRSVKVVGNIPYYITGKLLRILREAPRPPERTVLMVQKEVAERIVARPPKFNLLAAAVQFWAEPKILEVLPPRDFRPPPKIESALLLLVRRADLRADKERYYRALRMAFRQPRKTLLNNLLAGAGKPRGEIERILHSLKIPLQSRPQDLSVENIMHIAGEL